MSDPAKGPGVKADDDLSGDQGKHSGQRPAARFYEPLPLGANAFAAPLAPVPSEPPGPLARIPVLGLVLLVAAGLGGAAIGVAIALRPSAAHKAEPATTSIAHTSVSEPVALPAAAVQAPAGGAAPTAANPVAPRIPGARSAGVAPAASSSGASKPEPARPAHAIASAEDRGSDRTSSHHGHTAQRLPTQPDRAQVMAAMNALRPEVNACFGDKHGTATAEIRAIGRTGRVASVRVQGQSGGVGSCVARAVRKAHFPRFAADSITISYPFAH